MTDSILDSVKNVLGVDSSYTVFDLQILMHINSVFPTLSQIGIGPSVGFMIEDNTVTWDAFLANDDNLNSVKSYMYLRVRMLFDPPTTSFTIDAMKQQIQEFEWRLNVKREGESWTDPNPTPPPQVPPWWEIF